MEKKLADLNTLKSLHNWFKQLCQYGSSAWADRTYAEGQIYACREMLGDFDTKFGSVSRGFKFLTDNEWFMKGYDTFKNTYTSHHK